MLGNAAAAQNDIAGFYCPTRRSALRAREIRNGCCRSTWNGGGTDYGGCLGAGNGWDND